MVVRLVELRVTPLSGPPLFVFGPMDAVWMNLRAERQKLPFQQIRIQPGAPRLVQQGEVIGHDGSAADGTQSPQVSVTLQISSRAEALTARTAGGCVGVLDLEAAIK